MYIILKIQDKRAKSVNLDEVAHHEPPHQDLRCLQMYRRTGEIIGGGGAGVVSAGQFI